MASRRHIRRRACEQKLRFPTEQAAQRSLKHALERGREHMTVYKCEHCGGWHLGHQNRDGFMGRGASGRRL